MRPFSSAANARVKPTTPNFDAEYAVASLTAVGKRRGDRDNPPRARFERRERGGAHDRSRAEQVDMDDAVPRLAASSAEGPGHIDAGAAHHGIESTQLVDRGFVPSSAAAVSADLSRPWALRPSSADRGRSLAAPSLSKRRHTASPSPDAPPVTITFQFVGSSHMATSSWSVDWPVEDRCRRPPGQVRHGDDRTVPVFPSLLAREDRRRHSRHPSRTRPVARSRAPPWVCLRRTRRPRRHIATTAAPQHDRSGAAPAGRPFEPPHRGIAVEQHDKAITERPGPHQRLHMPGV